MNVIDWIILACFVLGLTSVALYFRRFNRSVADFLVANRCAKRYLLTAAEGAAGLGAISIVAQFEVYGAAGFTPGYWELIMLPMGLVLALSGWIIYRFRQTRCMTMAQFLEVRYGPKFRIFTGFVAFISGIVNYGIFPAVSARFFVYCIGLPESLSVAGTVIPTFVPLMLFLLGIGLLVTMTGGQVVIIVTDFLQGQMINIVFVIAAIVVLSKVSWAEIGTAMDIGSAPGASMANPFDTARAETFSFWFFLIMLFGRFYGYMCWQGNQGYNASAKTPHEARMARIIGQWRLVSLMLIPMMLALGAFVMLNHPAYASTGLEIRNELAMIENPQIQTQMTTPVALRYLLPAGVLGLFVAVMMACSISTDSTYLHSWGSIFLQDVVMPFRKEPFPPKQHLKLLRLSALGVAVFAFFFSLLFRQTEYIVLFFALTGALFASGAGICIIGGLYWRGGTTQGAWSAMLISILMVCTGFTLNRLIPDFPYNYLQIAFASQLTASLVYVLVSLATCRGKPFNLDRMLHRGDYAIPEDDAKVVQEANAPAALRPVLTSIQRRLGINEDFSPKDRLLYYATIGLLFAMLLTFFSVLVWNFTTKPDQTTWLKFWSGFVLVQLTLAIGTTIWILVGGFRDLRDMVIDLKATIINERDDGFIVHGHNRGEEVLLKEHTKNENALKHE